MSGGFNIFLEYVLETDDMKMLGGLETNASLNLLGDGQVEIL